MLVNSDLNDESTKGEIFTIIIKGIWELIMTLCLRLICSRLWKWKKIVILRSMRRNNECECDALRNQLREQRLLCELEINRLEARYKDEIIRLRKECYRYAHEVSPRSEEEELKLDVSEVVAHVKERFSKSGAEEVSIMLYHFAVEHDCLSKETFKLIDGIVPAIIKRDASRQTFNMPNVQQFNNNPRKVINKPSKCKKR